MAVYYATPMFPFSRLYPAGISMIVFGLFTLALGMLDLIYTVTRYYGESCEAEDYLDWECSDNPCNHESLIWVLLSPGIWSGFFIMVAGAILTTLMYASSSTIKSKRDGGGVLAGLITFPIGPGALAITGARLYYTNFTFYCTDALEVQGVTVAPLSGGLVIADYVLFIVPICVAVFVFLAWIMSLSVLVALCTQGRLVLHDQTSYDHRHRRNDDYYAPRARDYMGYDAPPPPAGRRPYVMHTVEEPYSLPRGGYANSSYAGQAGRPFPQHPQARRNSDPYATYPWFAGNDVRTTKTYDRY